MRKKPTDEKGRRGRVTASHEIARTAFRLAGVFAVIAAVWAIIVAVRGGSWWGPLHSFLAGTALLAISGATQMFTITWAAAVPPSSRQASLQRWSIAAGIGAVLIGVSSGTTWLTVIGATFAVAGVIILGGSLLSSIRKSLLRRFDLSARFYMLALASGTVGITLGAIMDWGVSPDLFARLRPAHAHLNLSGLVGFTIIGTLPTILATFAHHRAVSGREAVYAWFACVASAVLFVAGIFFGALPIGIGMLAVASAAATILVGVWLRLGRRGLKGALPYYMVTAGVIWLIIWAVVDAIALLSGSGLPPFSRWTGTAAVVGVGQVLIGSLSYLVPVLIGPAPRLGRNFRRLGEPLTPPLILANAGGVALIAGLGTAGLVLLGVWVADFLRRLVTLEWRDREEDDG